MMSEIKNIYEIKKVNLSLNDVLIVTVSDNVTREYVNDIRKYLSMALPDHTALNKILIMSKDINFEVIGVESIDGLLLNNSGK